MTTPQIPALTGCTPLGLSEAVVHTPTPWATQRDTGRRAYIHNDRVDIAVCSDLAPMAKGEYLANAAFIVSAVNAHQPLIDALAEMLVLAPSAIPRDAGAEYRAKMLAIIHRAEGVLLGARGDA